MTFLSFLTSAWVEWELTMCWDGLVSKLSQLSAAVAFMLVGALVVAVDDCVTLAVTMAVDDAFVGVDRGAVSDGVGALVGVGGGAIGGAMAVRWCGCLFWFMWVGS